MIGYAVTISAIIVLSAFFIFRYLGKERLSCIRDKVPLLRFVSAALIAALIAISGGSIAFMDSLDRSHDIDDAIGAAAVHFVHGGNPYEDEVVPRFTEVYHDDVKMVNGTLNYLPLTLFVYSGAYLCLGFVGSLWYELTNLLLGLSAAIVLWRTFPTVRKGILFPAVGIVTVFFLFDNIMLTLLMFSMFLYFLLRSGSGFRVAMALISLFLAFSVKMAGMMSLGAFVLFIAQRYRFKDRMVNVQIGLFVLFAMLAAAASIAIFGYRDLMDSTFLFMSDPDVRSDGAHFGGTVLTEIVGNSPAFTYIGYAVLLSVLVATMFMKGVLPRLFMAEAVLPFVTIKDSQSLLAIPILLLSVNLMAIMDPELEPFRDPDRGEGPKSELMCW